MVTLSRQCCRVPSSAWLLHLYCRQFRQTFRSVLVEPVAAVFCLRHNNKANRSPEEITRNIGLVAIFLFIHINGPAHNVPVYNISMREPYLLASLHILYLDLYFFRGEKTIVFFPSPPCTFHNGISTGLIWLIDFEVVQTQFFVMRRISWQCLFLHSFF